MVSSKKQRRVRPKKSLYRRWISFRRVVRYGAENFVRNAWLSLAAILIMTVTLLVIIIAMASNHILKNTVDNIRDRVDMSIYVKNTIDEATVEKIKSDIQALSSVMSVQYVSSKEAKTEIAKNNADDDDVLDALNEASNRLPGTYNVKIVNINDPSQLQKYIETNSTIKKWLDPNQPPSFSSSRRTAIDNIAKHADFAERAGLIVAVVFVGIAMLVVFNTIRMAIFNRKGEIYMMRLIGADPSFVRRPFIVEAVLNGVISAIIATSLGYVLLDYSKHGVAQSGVDINQTLQLAHKYWFVVYGAVIVLGVFIGIVSSFMATGKYLKNKTY